MKTIESTLRNLLETGNFRTVPERNVSPHIVDLSLNDYLGIAENKDLIDNFLSSLRSDKPLMSSSASRLLAGHQEDYTELEAEIASQYGRPVLLFNSGYHANTGIVRAFADKQTLFVADKLVHASIIDGLMSATAAGASFLRFRHNDFAHLSRVISQHGAKFDRVVVIVESIYSMDGDATDLDALTEVKQLHPNVLLYVDEAHSVGVIGDKGLGMSRNHPKYDSIDIVVGTFGKALASIGAFAAVSPEIREYLVNTARSFIFSTALPPVNIRWSLATFRYSLTADAERQALGMLGKKLQDILGGDAPSHIQPFIVGDAKRAVELSEDLLHNGFRVMPIRTPTVPAGTERLRFSLSAAIPPESLAPLVKFFTSLTSIS